MRKNKLNNEAEIEEGELGMPPFMFMQPPAAQDDGPKMRKIGLIGDVNEEKTNDLIYGLYALKEMGKITGEAKGKKKPKITYDPIELIISTHGGSASEMFAIFDVMRDVRKECDIQTFGLGKVMSAGVLLLAAGTKGQRRIGKNCRVMMHSVIAGNSGSIHNLQNEMAEVLETQKRYIEALRQETKMSVKKINEFFNRHVDIYLSAEEAVKLGIADIVV